MTEQLLDPLLAIGAADGRYRGRLSHVAPLASEFGLMHNRVRVECEWLSALADCAQIPELPALNESQSAALRDIHESFSRADAATIKKFEETTNHDVKAVEYFVKQRLQAIPGLAPHVEFVHFACTSEDINSSAYALMLTRLRREVLVPAYQSVITALGSLANDNADVAMMSRTHGQPASPTTLGKELRNVCERLTRQLAQFEAIGLMGKLNGAVGNYNAHYVAYPDVDWPALSAQVLTAMDLQQNPYTTQIEPHDYIAEYSHCLMRLNQILIDLCRDVWAYIAIEYFKQRQVAGETGSSTMPHKVNPIDFENAEGNLGVANALLGHLADKLPISRWQRDLSDSTVLRNIGTATAHCVIATSAAHKGLGKLNVNHARIAADLGDNWEVLGEAVQTVMRRFGMSEPYERLKAATRGRKLDQASYAALLAELDLPPEAQALLDGLTPADYIGNASATARQS
ncbi:MAG: adenylosuccinate lyase [Pseudomonadales bacterium]